MENKDSILALLKDVRTRMEQLSDSDKIIDTEALFALLDELKPENEIHYMVWK
jgi:hypothetical protein